MKGRRKLTEYGAPPISKTPSPRPVAHHETPLPKTHSAPTAVFHAAQNTMPLAFPVIYDAEIEELARLPLTWLQARKTSMVVDALMYEWVHEYSTEATENANENDIDQAIRAKTENSGITVSIYEINLIIKSLTKDACPPSFSRIDRLDFLKNKMTSGEMLFSAFSNQLILWNTNLLVDFTDSYRALTLASQQESDKENPDEMIQTCRKASLDEKMQKHISQLAYTDCQLLSDWLAYAARPNIPGEELPRLPDIALETLIKQLNNPPKDLSSLSNFITDYTDLTKKIDRDPSACRQLLVTFSSEYAKLEENEKKQVLRAIFNSLRMTQIHDIKYLHEILEFAGSKLPENKNHLFPSEISFAISETLRDHQLVLRYGNILEEAITLAKKNINTMMLFKQFHKDYRMLSDTAKNKIILVISKQINFQISIEDFLLYKDQIKLLQTVLDDPRLDKYVKAKELLIQTIQTKDEDSMAVSASHKKISVTRIGMFTANPATETHHQIAALNKK